MSVKKQPDWMMSSGAKDTTTRNLLASIVSVLDIAGELEAPTGSPLRSSKSPNFYYTQARLRIARANVRHQSVLTQMLLEGLKTQNLETETKRDTSNPSIRSLIASLESNEQMLSYLREMLDNQQCLTRRAAENDSWKRSKTQWPHILRRLAL